MPKPCIASRYRQHFLAWDSNGRLLPFRTTSFSDLLSLIDACGYTLVSPNSATHETIMTTLHKKLSNHDDLYFRRLHACLDNGNPPQK